MSNVDRLDHLRSMLKEEPRDVFLHYAIALELKALHDLPAAMMQFYELLDIDPGNIPGHYQMALVFDELGRCGDALGIARKGLELASDQRDLKAMAELRELIQRLQDHE